MPCVLPYMHSHGVLHNRNTCRKACADLFGAVVDDCCDASVVDRCKPPALGLTGRAWLSSVRTHELASVPMDQDSADTG